MTVSAKGVTQKAIRTTSHGQLAKDPRITNGGGQAGQAPDGYCYWLGTYTCTLNYNGGNIMHNAQLIIDVWAGTSYGNCNGMNIYEPSGSDCHYIWLQELFFQDFCAGTGSAGFFQVINQYTDGSGSMGSCKLVGGGAQEYPGGYSVQYTYDSTPFPNDGNCPGATTCITDANIQSSAEAIANYNGCTQDGIHCFVAVLLPYNVCQDPKSNGGWCAPTGQFDGFCAYHSIFTTGGKTLMYADMPDAGAANCGTTGAPTGDTLGDLEVSPLSHEMAETMTDPNPVSGWYDNSVPCCEGEIGDLCAYDGSGQTGGLLVGTEPFDGSNLHMGPNYDVNGYVEYDPYDVQPEWSNAVGGCTFSENGAPTLVQQTLTPDIAGTPTLGNAFLTSYVEAGSTNYASYVYEPAGVNDIWVTPFYNVVTYPYCDDGDSGASGVGGCEQVGYNFAYCFSQTCDAQPVTDNNQYGTTLFLNYYYYLSYEEQPYMNILKGGTPPSVNIAWLTPPKCGSSCNGVADSYAARSAPLPIGPGGHYPSLDAWPVYGTQMHVPTIDTKSATERFTTFASTVNTFVTINSATPVALGITYHHQYFLKVTYTCSGTTCPSGFTANPVSAWYLAGTLTAVTASANGWQFTAWKPAGPVTLVTSATVNPNALTVTGTSASMNVNFIPGVSLSMSKTSLSIAPGGTGTSTATIKGAPQSVTMSCSSGCGSPSTTTISVKFATNPVTDSISGVTDGVTITVGSAVAAGTHTITITAKGTDGITSSVKLTITVT